MIDDAYPVQSNGDPVEWYDKCLDHNSVKWEKGPPPIPPFHSIDDTVGRADLKFSLQWIVDRVNWIWGGRTAGAVAKQIISETGWASAQPYEKGTRVVGDPVDAEAYYLKLKSLDFKIDNCPVVYFIAYDEPLKTPNTSAEMFSENHYGINGWTGIQKYEQPPVPANPLLKEFTILSIVPFNPQGYPRMRVGESPADTRYDYQVTGQADVNVQWYRGVNMDSTGVVVPNSICWLPNPDILMAAGDRIAVSNPSPSDTITLDCDGSSIKYASPTAGSHLNPESNDLGTSWILFLSDAWDHGGSPSPTAEDRKVTADWWGE